MKIYPTHGERQRFKHANELHLRLRQQNVQRFSLLHHVDPVLAVRKTLQLQPIHNDVEGVPDVLLNVNDVIAVNDVERLCASGFGRRKCFRLARADCGVHLEGVNVLKRKVARQQVGTVAVEREVLSVVRQVLRLAKAIAHAVAALADGNAGRILPHGAGRAVAARKAGSGDVGALRRLNVAACGFAFPSEAVVVDERHGTLRLARMRRPPRFQMDGLVGRHALHHVLLQHRTFAVFGERQHVLRRQGR